MMESVTFDGEEILYDISTPIIAVAGMGEKTNKMELQIDLAISLQKDKYKIVWISSRMKLFCIVVRDFQSLCTMREYQKRKKS